jgi:hypothetical protein
MDSERTPLVKSDRSESFYFINQNSGASALTRDGEWTPDPLSKRHPSIASSSVTEERREGFLSWLGGLFGKKKLASNDITSKLRKVPIKVEPKVFFANERTFLAWLHMAMTLGGVSLAICAFAEENEWR